MGNHNDHSAAVVSTCGGLIGKLILFAIAFAAAIQFIGEMARV